MDQRVYDWGSNYSRLLSPSLYYVLYISVNRTNLKIYVSIRGLLVGRLRGSDRVKRKT